MSKLNFNNLPFFVGMGVVFLLIVFMLISREKYKAGSQLANPKPSSVVSVENSNVKARAYLQKIFSGEVKYNDSFDTVKYATFGTDNLDILSYKYESGNTTFTNNYEGSEWKVDLSKEVDSFLSLKPGFQKLTTCASLFGCSVRNVIGHKFGSRMWGSVDEYFQPGATWTRVYYTFDSNTNQIIYVKVNFYGVTKGDADEGVLLARPEFVSILQKVESEVLSL